MSDRAHAKPISPADYAERQRATLAAKIADAAPRLVTADAIANGVITYEELSGVAGEAVARALGSVPALGAVGVLVTIPGVGHRHAEATHIFLPLEPTGEPAVALGAAAGTGGSVAVSVTWGNDRVFLISLVTGTSGVGAGTLATITFAAPRSSSNYTVDPKPHSAAAKDSQAYVTSRSTTGFALACRVSPGTGATLTFGFVVDGEG